MPKIVIIGLGTAGFAAALEIKKKDRKSEITIIDKKDFDLLHSCGLPYFLERKVDSLSKLKHDIKAGMMGINIMHNSKATKIDTEKKAVFYEKDNEKKEIAYDKLIISTGSCPFIPPIDGIKGNNGVFTVSSSSDTEKLDNSIEKSKTAIIIGAGAIGLETAYALKKRGLDVTIIDMLDSAFPKQLIKIPLR